MQVYWEQVLLSTLESEQVEDVALEIGGFRESGKPRGMLSLADSADVFASCGEFAHQGP